MSPSHGLEFIETIAPTYENAQAIQRLALQDVLAGGFANPFDLADPFDPNMVEAQKTKLQKHPVRYCGYLLEGELVAFMKHNAWTHDDELPFASKPKAAKLKAGTALRIKPRIAQWGVFGLVASEALPKEDRDFMLKRLLRQSMTDFRNGRPRAVNIVFHNEDPALSIAQHLGFLPIGVLAEADGAKGLKQRRYRRQPPKK